MTLQLAAAASVTVAVYEGENGDKVAGAIECRISLDWGLGLKSIRKHIMVCLYDN